MPSESAHRALRQQGRGVVGALVVVGLTFLYTMESWHLAVTLPLSHLLVYTLGGLVLILLIARNIGFREQEESRPKTPLPDLVTEFTEILLQSFVASYVVLFVLGIVEWGSSLIVILRLGLLEVVPLGFGAALANRLFAESGEADSEEGKFPQNVAVFSLGALFIAAPISPTAEMELIAANMSWAHSALLIGLTLLVVYVALYTLDFRGQLGRSYDNTRYEIGTTFLVYGISVVVSAALLWSYGHFTGATLALVVQETIVLSFPAAVAAAGAQVIL